MAVICLQKILFKKGMSLVFILLFVNLILACSSTAPQESIAKAAQIRSEEMLSDSIRLFERYGLIDESIALLRQVSKIAPDKLIMVESNLGWIYLQSNQIEDAIFHYQEAIRLNPDFATAHFYLGDAFLRKQLFDKSIQSYKRAINIFTHKLKKRYDPNEIDGLREEMLNRRALSYGKIGLVGDLMNDVKVSVPYTYKSSVEFLKINDLTGKANLKARVTKETLEKMLKKYNFNSMREASFALKDELIALSHQDKAK